MSVFGPKLKSNQRLADVVTDKDVDKAEECNKKANDAETEAASACNKADLTSKAMSAAAEAAKIQSRAYSDANAERKKKLEVEACAKDEQEKSKLESQATAERDAAQQHVTEEQAKLDALPATADKTQQTAALTKAKAALDDAIKNLADCTAEKDKAALAHSKAKTELADAVKTSDSSFKDWKDAEKKAQNLAADAEDLDFTNDELRQLLEKTEKDVAEARDKQRIIIQQGQRTTYSQAVMENAADAIVKRVLLTVESKRTWNDDQRHDQTIYLLQYLCKTINPHLLLAAPRFPMDGRVGTFALEPRRWTRWTLMALLPTLVLWIPAYILGAVLANQLWILFFLAVVYIILTSVIGVTPTAQPNSQSGINGTLPIASVDDVAARTALTIIGLITSIINSIGAAYAAAGLEKVSAPSVAYTSAFFVAFFSDTNSKNDQVKRLLGEEGLNPTELALLAKVKAEIIAYQCEIISFFVWNTFLTSQHHLSGDSLAALSQMYTTLERERVRITTWDVVDALAWGVASTDANAQQIPAFLHRYTNVILLMNSSECKELIRLAEKSFNSKPVLLTESLSSVEIIAKLQNASLAAQAENNVLLSTMHNQMVQNALQQREDQFVKSAVSKLDTNQDLTQKEKDHLKRYLPANSRLDDIV